MKPFIYALVDPLEPDHYRYIGYATYKSRPDKHKSHALCAKSPSYKIHWILKLLASGRMYDIRILEEFEDDISKENLCLAEIRHIEEAKKNGHKLTNSTLGGEKINFTEGVRGKMRKAWTPERRKQWSILKKGNTSALGNKLSLETRRKMSQSRTRDKKPYKLYRQTGSLEDQLRKTIQRLNIWSKVAEEDLVLRERALQAIEQLLQRLEKLQVEINERIA